MTLSDAKARLARLLRDVEELGEEVFITRSGRPAAVLLSIDDYEGLHETLEILADAELRESVRRGLAELERGELVGESEVWSGLDDSLQP